MFKLMHIYFTSFEFMCSLFTNNYWLCSRPRLRGNHSDTRDRTVSSSSEEEAAAAAASSSLSPLSLLSLPSFKDVGSEKGGEKEVWVSVFSYLSRAELLSCMTVCKAWYKWYVCRHDLLDFGLFSFAIQGPEI